MVVGGRGGGSQGSSLLIDREILSETTATRKLTFKLLMHTGSLFFIDIFSSLDIFACSASVIRTCTVEVFSSSRAKRAPDYAMWTPVLSQYCIYRSARALRICRLIRVFVILIVEWCFPLQNVSSDVVCTVESQ